MKNHSCNLHAPLCGIFCPNSVAVARYGALIRTKSPTNCDAHLAESLFQTRSRACLKKVHDVKDASAFLSFMYLFIDQISPGMAVQTVRRRSIPPRNSPLSVLLHQGEIVRLDKMHKKRTSSQTFHNFLYYARRTSEWSHRRYLYS